MSVCWGGQIVRSWARTCAIVWTMCALCVSERVSSWTTRSCSCTRTCAAGNPLAMTSLTHSSICKGVQSEEFNRSGKGKK